MSATDAEAEFGAFVRARQGALLHAATLMTGDFHTAQDLVQEALIKLAERWESINRGAEYAYARRTMYRDSVSRWRKIRRENLHADPSLASGQLGADSYQPIEAWTSATPIREALLQLPPKQRAVMVLRYFEDQSEKQIAETLGISVGTVKSQASAAASKLRNLLPEHVPALTGSEGQ